MAWTAPRTWVAAEVVTAALLNTHVKNNLLETAPAKATTAGGIFVATGSNAIAERVPTAGSDFTSRTTASTSYVALTGQVSVTVTTGTAAIVMWSAYLANNSATDTSFLSVDVSGATTVAAADTRALAFTSHVANQAHRGGYIYTYSSATVGALTAGSNTFALEARVTGGTGTFDDQVLTVIPL